MQPLTRITAATIDVLRVLDGATSPCWGLLIIKQSGRPTGSVYPILERLESLGWLTSRWEDDNSRPGPRRRFYELTADGTKGAALALAEFDSRTQRTTAPRRSTPALAMPSFAAAQA